MVKVSLVKCPSYERAKVFDSVKRAVDLVGGIKSFVRPGTKVLVKPNLLSARGPEEGVDTHPEVVRAVVQLVKSAGALPLIGDSPGGYGADIDEIFDKSGMRSMAESESVELVKFTSSKFVDGIPFTRYLSECDRVISVPKLKTHCLTVLTAAIKNMYGTVTGLYKVECHSKSPKEEDFAKVIAKVYSIAKPHLTVVDGIEAMEGDGPSGGNLRKMNLLMAGADAVAIDTCAAAIIGLDPLSVLITKEAFTSGLGEADLSKIELTGDSISDFLTTDFKLPQTAVLRLIPKTAVNAVAGLIKFKPYINMNICARCNLCKTTCPAGAIEIGRDLCRIDYKKCVRCLCCQEVCPYKAISIKRNILAKLVWG
jgi:uncharacterized protein (DUF362 family)/NAD-dependent dihydropyrimidine dehydrogenase PreA subunit